MVKPLLFNYENQILGNNIQKKTTSINLQVNPLNYFNKLIGSFPPNSVPDPNFFKINSNYQFELDKSSFFYQPKKIVEEYESKDISKLPDNELLHYQSLKYSLSFLPSKLLKYFHEVPIIKNSVSAKNPGGHYDWRFFNGVIKSEYEIRIILHHMLRSWLKFTYSNNLVAWIAHGSLLSWYWNGYSFNWDNDIDVQMPITELDKLAKYYNNSLIIENLNDGFGKYYIDCGSFITHRRKGNGKNNIDSRIIDIDTGMYVDITGLALTSSRLPIKYRKYLSDTENYDFLGNPDKKVKGLTSIAQRFEINNNLQIYNCRNNHFVLFSSISPMKISLVEGTKGFIPNDYKSILLNEYKSNSLTLTKFNRHYFISKLRMWVPIMSIKKFLTHQHSQLIKAGKKFEKKNFTKQLEDLSNSDDLILELLLFDEEILKEFYLTHDITRIHFAERQSLDKSKSNKKVIDKIEFKPYLKDLFFYRHDKIKELEEQGKKYDYNEKFIHPIENIAQSISMKTNHDLDGFYNRISVENEYPNDSQENLNNLENADSSEVASEMDSDINKEKDVIDISKKESSDSIEEKISVDEANDKLKSHSDYISPKIDSKLPKLPEVKQQSENQAVDFHNRRPPPKDDFRAKDYDEDY
ncbi:Mnn14p ASCRUDRAFT_73522 [Ascoidea rubescens DSM 1968]|uniref:LicD/FKTN/FKRP nucleotidyltransferase domain-containing protein n=1 Tax=Ascoidea rubescens DSM 1968 TaxID=1344418 RepID=A0A1D2VQ61_9ASCO|nr:hypothetical protein ASCRUDRAFT_73522 [Ascoidea rubescens DSM 1968]ODV63724.1 hypothetical protein ASCRUDRAFT_73522 [Ascoidea rubescens DSM 1968]